MKKLSILLLLCSIFLLAACHESDSTPLSKETPAQIETAKLTDPTTSGLQDSRENVDIKHEIVKLNNQVQWRADYTVLGTFHEDMALYRTSDGGQTWMKLSDTKEKNSTLPQLAHTGLFFLNEQTGWVTTSTPAEGDIGLYLTQDGGFTWTHEKPAIPENYKREQFKTMLPFFFTPENSILVANNTSGKPLILLSQTGGKNWTAITDTKMTGATGQMRWDLRGEAAGPSAPWKVNIHKQTWESTDQGQSWTSTADSSTHNIQPAEQATSEALQKLIPEIKTYDGTRQKQLTWGGKETTATFSVRYIDR